MATDHAFVVIGEDEDVLHRADWAIHDIET
jgi:hypothetical protein